MNDDERNESVPDRFPEPASDGIDPGPEAARPLSPERPRPEDRSCSCPPVPVEPCAAGTCGCGRYVFALCLLASLALNGYLAYQLRFERLVTREQAARIWLKQQHNVLLVPEPSTRAITSVHFQGRELDDQMLERTADLFRLSSIHLGETNITDEQLRYISGLSHLASLVLSDTKISNEGLPSLAGLKKLEFIHLPGTEITNEGLKMLVAIPNLKMLDLSRTAVNDEGLKYLQAARNLEWVLLTGNHITDAGLEHLKSLPNLKRLTLNNTRVTIKGKSALMKANPKLAIDHLMGEASAPGEPGFDTENAPDAGAADEPSESSQSRKTDPDVTSEGPDE